MAESKSSSSKTTTANDPAKLAELSRDADKSTYKANPNPNPANEHPAPGPSTIQELGKP